MKKRFSMLRASVLVTVSLLLMSVFFVACDKDDHVDNTPAAGLMALNLAPDLSATIAIDGSYLTPAPLAYTTYTGGYYRIFPGSRMIQTFDFSNTNLLDTTSYNFEQDKYYSVFVLGTQGSYEHKIVFDDFDALTATAGKAYIRYINAIPDISNPVVTITAGGTNVADGSVPYTTVSNFLQVDAGDVMVDVDNGGTIDANRTVTLEERGVYTALLVGMPGSTGADSVSIRYVKNGTLDEEATTMNSVKPTGSK